MIGGKPDRPRVVGDAGEADNAALRANEFQEPDAAWQRANARALLGADAGGVEAFDTAARVEDGECRVSSVQESPGKLYDSLKQVVQGNLASQGDVAERGKVITEGCARSGGIGVEW